MLGLVNMRHKFRFVRSPPFIEFTLKYSPETTRLSAPIRGQAVQLANVVALTRLRIQKFMRFCFAYGKTQEGSICEGGSQGVWRSKCCDLLCRIRTRPSLQCQFRRKKELIFRTQDDWNVVYPIFITMSTSTA
jgi:hypothetical protein